ncbi:MAG TPA: hypothetical protein VFU14_20385 [Acidimicrobiales bacterium]|nr:hypothetical protein [Acidimicrobiales bacterium]
MRPTRCRWARAAESKVARLLADGYGPATVARLAGVEVEEVRRVLADQRARRIERWTQVA